MKPLELISNYKLIIQAQLEKFVECYSGKQAFEISALAEKLDHMAFGIGSPSSIEPMLKSIISGKIKHWSTGIHGYSSANADSIKPYDNGAQIKGKHVAEMQRRWGKWKYQDGDNDRATKLVDKGYVTGHFRWNYTAYKLDRETRDYIYNFWFNEAYVPTVNHIPIRMKNLTHGIVSFEGGRIPFHDNPFKYDKLVVNTKDYRWVYYRLTTPNSSGKPDEVFQCNIGDGSVNFEEMEVLRNLMKEKKSKR